MYLNPHFDIDAVVDDLRAVTDDDGEPLFADIYHAETVYDGQYVDVAPELLIDQRPGVTINDGRGGDRVQSSPRRWAAENARGGIFVASVPDFEACGHLGTTDIRDIAPTVLTAHGVAVPSDFEGKVPPVVGAEPERCKPIQIGGRDAGPPGEVADRLKQLGYME